MFYPQSKVRDNTMIKQSDLKIKLEVGEKKRITDNYGLCLIVQGTKNGTTYKFFSRVSYKGKRVEKALNTSSLSEAREIALKRYNNIKSGVDPDVDSSIPIFKVVATEYFENLKKNTITTHTYKSYMGVLNNNVYPIIGDYPITNITPSIVLEKVINPILDKLTL